MVKKSFLFLAVHKYSDGKKFQGNYEGNRKNGRGTFSYPDGRCFEGNYKFDLRHGGGKLVYPDGSELSGCWSNGLMVSSEF